VLRWFWGVAFLCVFVLAAGLQARQALKPKPMALPPVPEEVLKPDFNRRFEPLPHSPPVKLKGQITNGNNLKP
jgi:hypothetical protein